MGIELQISGKEIQPPSLSPEELEEMGFLFGDLPRSPDFYTQIEKVMKQGPRSAGLEKELFVLLKQLQSKEFALNVFLESSNDIVEMGGKLRGDSLYEKNTSKVLVAALESLSRDEFVDQFDSQTLVLMANRLTKDLANVLWAKIVNTLTPEELQKITSQYAYEVVDLEKGFMLCDLVGNQKNTAGLDLAEFENSHYDSINRLREDLISRSEMNVSGKFAEKYVRLLLKVSEESLEKSLDELRHVSPHLFESVKEKANEMSVFVEERRSSFQDYGDEIRQRTTYLFYKKMENIIDMTKDYVAILKKNSFGSSTNSTENSIKRLDEFQDEGKRVLSGVEYDFFADGVPDDSSHTFYFSGIADSSHDDGLARLSGPEGWSELRGYEQVREAVDEFLDKYELLNHEKPEGLLSLDKEEVVFGNNFDRELWNKLNLFLELIPESDERHGRVGQIISDIKSVDEGHWEYKRNPLSYSLMKMEGAVINRINNLDEKMGFFLASVRSFSEHDIEVNYEEIDGLYKRDQISAADIPEKEMKEMEVVYMEGMGELYAEEYPEFLEELREAFKDSFKKSEVIYNREFYDGKIKGFMRMDLRPDNTYYAGSLAYSRDVQGYKLANNIVRKVFDHVTLEELRPIFGHCNATESFSLSHFSGKNGFVANDLIAREGMPVSFSIFRDERVNDLLDSKDKTENDLLAMLGGDQEISYKTFDDREVTIKRLGSIQYNHEEIGEGVVLTRFFPGDSEKSFYVVVYEDLGFEVLDSGSNFSEE